ncbi:MAG: hypothetical protein R3D34_16300 [Nitratireductor sp.]
MTLRKRIADSVWGRDPRFGHAFDYAMIALVAAATFLMATDIDG